jgi:hypothetical protein
MSQLNQNTNTIKKLSVDTAQALVNKKEHFIDLSGVTELSVATAAVLATHHGSLNLDGLTEISTAAAQKLGQHENGSLYLNGLTELSADAAEALANHDGHCIWTG